MALLATLALSLITSSGTCIVKKQVLALVLTFEIILIRICTQQYQQM